MTADEIAWLDGYHASVWEAVSPHLDDETRRWLERSTQPLR
ncbi:MAG TPA: M24 family metallopeptidase C-terminal domain-containing protein [Microvirga sp.]|nr:M24 family metallopeptidase C-terminal domain-containing protein [Microvirga sp.]